MRPKVLDGTSVEKASRLQFSGGAGGELECAPGDKLTTSGFLKIQGFTESELLDVKDP